MRAKGDMHFQKCAQLVAYDEKNGLSWMLMTTFASTKCSFEDLRNFWNITAAKVESWSFFVFHVEIHLG